MTGRPDNAPLHPFVPGARIAGDWHAGAVPANVEAGEDVLIDSASAFRHFRSTRRPGLRIGCRVTLFRASLATELDGLIEIGDDSHLSGASVVAAQGVSIGRRVLICGGATLVDSHLHPLPLTTRVADTIAIGPLGDRAARPSIEARPVVIEDDVWIGWNALVLPGVRVGAGAVVNPGSIVTRDVPAGATVAGNPAGPVVGDPA